MRPPPWLWAVALAAAFFLAGSLFISSPGLEADESIFGMDAFYPSAALYKARIFRRDLPLMHLSYLGSLKALLYKPIFAIWQPSAASVRLPMVLAGSVFLLLTWWVVRSLDSPWTATAAAALLAFDPSLLWSVRCDWGPVALQLLLTMGGIAAMIANRIPLGFFLFGLSFWNKAVFVWAFAGLVAAWLATYRRAIPWRTVVVSTLTLAAGAYPLIRYNLSARGRTTAETAHFSVAELPAKFEALRAGLDGRSLYGYMMREQEAPPALPRSTLTSWMLLAALPLALRRRGGRFVAAALVVSWLFMAITVKGGDSLHHVVTLWPWPQCLIALGLAEVVRRQRLVATAIVAAAALANAAVSARHTLLVTRHGADPPWSDAIYELDRTLTAERMDRVWVNDWGIVEPLALLGRGRRQLEMSHDVDPVRVASRPDWVVVGYVPRFEVFPGVATRLTPSPAYRKDLIRTISDRQGVPVFEVFRIARAPQSP